MHTLPPRTAPSIVAGASSISSSLTAFAFALAGAAVTSRLIFDHQVPTQPEDVVPYLATLGAAVIAGWWLANVSAWAMALRRGVQLDRFTLPGTKRIAQIVLAVSLSTSCVADASGDPVMMLVKQAADSTTPLTPPTTIPTTIPATMSPDTTAPPTTAPPTTTPLATTPLATTPLATTPPDAEVPPAEDQPVPPADEPVVAGTIENHQVIVSEGDNLWSLAAETLTLHGLDAPSCGQVADYWRLVVAANQVQSGNADMLGIGEALTMPAFDLATFGGQPSPTGSPQPVRDIAVR